MEVTEQGFQGGTVIPEDYDGSEESLTERYGRGLDLGGPLRTLAQVCRALEPRELVDLVDLSARRAILKKDGPAQGDLM